MTEIEKAVALAVRIDQKVHRALAGDWPSRLVDLGPIISTQLFAAASAA